MGDADIHIHFSDKKRLQTLEIFLTQFLFINPSSCNLSNDSQAAGGWAFSPHLLYHPKSLSNELGKIIFSSVSLDLGVIIAAFP